MSHDPAKSVSGLNALGAFVAEMTHIVQRCGHDEPALLSAARAAMADLLATDDWLDDEFATPGMESYRQYLLFLDPLTRFSVVSFVWTEGQCTPVHDHMTWGLVGVLRGSEVSETFELRDGHLVSLAETMMHAGDIAELSPSIGDIHRVRHASNDGPSISIHVYGGDIGAIERHTIAPDGIVKSFVSGYTNRTLPTLRIQ